MGPARKIGRRTILKGMMATGFAGIAGKNIAFAAPRAIKIGLVMPQTGILAAFCEHMPFTLDQVKNVTGGNLTINGAAHPFEIIVKDSQSDPNRASEVAQE